MSLKQRLRLDRLIGRMAKRRPLLDRDGRNIEALLLEIAAMLGLLVLAGAISALCSPVERDGGQSAGYAPDTHPKEKKGFGASAPANVSAGVTPRRAYRRGDEGQQAFEGGAAWKADTLMTLSEKPEGSETAATAARSHRPRVKGVLPHGMELALAGVAPGHHLRTLTPWSENAHSVSIRTVEIRRPGNAHNLVHAGSVDARSQGVEKIRSEVHSSNNQERRGNGGVTPPPGTAVSMRSSEQPASGMGSLLKPQIVAKLRSGDSWYRIGSSQRLALRATRSHPLEAAIPAEGRAARRVRLEALATVQARKCRVDPALFVRLIARESAFRPDALSKHGAIGLAQVKAYHFGPLLNPWDARTNLSQGACLLRRHYERVRRYTTEAGAWTLALAAYNGGQFRTSTTEKTREYAADIMRGLAQ